MDFNREPGSFLNSPIALYMAVSLHLLKKQQVSSGATRISFLRSPGEGAVPWEGCGREPACFFLGVLIKICCTSLRRSSWSIHLPNRFAKRGRQKKRRPNRPAVSQWCSDPGKTREPFLGKTRFFVGQPPKKRVPLNN